MNKKQKGFSLIELLIVVAIILIIADIAIPNLLRAKIAANQASAVGSLRTMSSAEETFSSTFSDGYALTLAQLGGPAGSQGCKNAGFNRRSSGRRLRTRRAVMHSHSCPTALYREPPESHRRAACRVTRDF
jgi:prepilin-type N-terminal cleavage/methylation domain-containing protein